MLYLRCSIWTVDLPARPQDVAICEFGARLSPGPVIVTAVVNEREEQAWHLHPEMAYALQDRLENGWKLPLNLYRLALEGCPFMNEMEELLRRYYILTESEVDNEGMDRLPAAAGHRLRG